MAEGRSIDTAPRDGTRVTLYWTDRDGQENRSIGRYFGLDRLKRAGGEWDEGDEGWWIFTDGDTQFRVDPHGWMPLGSGDDGEEERGGA